MARIPVDGFRTGHYTATDASSDYDGGFTPQSGTATGVRL